MKPRLSLKHHLTLTYILLAVVVAGAFSLVSYISIKIIEDQIVDAPGGLEETELVILLSLAVGFVVSVILAAGLGVWSVRRVIAPVAALADAVARFWPWAGHDLGRDRCGGQRCRSPSTLNRHRDPHPSADLPPNPEDRARPRRLGEKWNRASH